jgi:hypothetical protein
LLVEAFGVVLPGNMTIFGMGTNSTVHFSVGTTTTPPSPSPSPEPTDAPPNSEPFPTTPVATSIASVAVVSVGLIVYFKKRHHKTENSG